ncbi:MAG: dihydrofolate reductase, partial [bacterium]
VSLNPGSWLLGLRKQTTIPFDQNPFPKSRSNSPGLTMRLALIAAMDRNRLIGKDKALPWRLPADMRHFKAVTMGKPVIMGRKTHESIGIILPGRKNIVVTRNKDYQSEGCVIVHSLQEALEAAQDAEEAVVIGGAALYEMASPVADRLYLTFVDAELQGDTYFPEIHFKEWREIERQDFQADEKNPYPHSFVTFIRQSHS